MLNARDCLGCDQRHPVEKGENEIRMERKTATQLCMNKHVLGSVCPEGWALKDITRVMSQSVSQC